MSSLIFYLSSMSFLSSYIIIGKKFYDWIERSFSGSVQIYFIWLLWDDLILGDGLCPRIYVLGLAVDILLVLITFFSNCDAETFILTSNNCSSELLMLSFILILVSVNSESTGNSSVVENVLMLN